MARRSSARLRNRTSSTPKRVSLAHDAASRTPRTAPSKLCALQEGEEMPGAFPRSASPPETATPSAEARKVVKIPVRFDDATPEHVQKVQPAAEEMHPQQHYQSTAKALDEARWLGFTDMAPYTEPPRERHGTLNGVEDTPTKAPKSEKCIKSSKFEFTFRREQSLELSPEAKKLMNEKREEAAKIREQMLAAAEHGETTTQAVGRKIATPKGAKGRFSDVHKQQFQKMDSIAGHASAFRAHNKPSKESTPLAASEKSQHIQVAASRSLKRSPSKADLDQPESAIPRPLPCSTSKLGPLHAKANAIKTTPSKNVVQAADEARSSPAKRVRRNENDIQSKTQEGTPGSSGKAEASTPHRAGGLVKQASYPDLSTLTTPTQASLARTTTATKIPGPSFTQSPAKSAAKKIFAPDHDGGNMSTPLLARSPVKAHSTSKPEAEESKPMLSPLLLRSPSKSSTLQKPVKDIDASPSSTKKAALFSRSPLKMPVARKPDMKEANEKPHSAVPLLARSPLKISVTSRVSGEQAADVPNKSTSSNLMDRLKLLRASPVKSILRTPQRLYSDDPAKVAAGTHLATPPKFTAIERDATPTPLRKHVDFSSSTKARYERAHSEQNSTPSKETTPVAPSGSDPKATLTDYPSLPTTLVESSHTPPSRRQTTAPGDFTFRADTHGIVFGPSPSASQLSTKLSPAVTIRHVSAEPDISTAASARKRNFEFENNVAEKETHRPIPTPLPVLPPSSRKRKFDFENNEAVESAGPGGVIAEASDKENDDASEHRPTKRLKAAVAPPSPMKKRATLGVKPKGVPKSSAARDKKPSTISLARLNALAQPKRRA